MVGILPGQARMQSRLVMGYRHATARCDSLLLPRGEKVRGHEFHYSEWTDLPADLPFAYDVMSHEGEAARREGFAQGNLLASYTHLHFAARPEMAQRWVGVCSAWQQGGRIP